MEDSEMKSDHSGHCHGWTLPELSVAVAVQYARSARTGSVQSASAEDKTNRCFMTFLGKGMRNSKYNLFYSVCGPTAFRTVYSTSARIPKHLPCYPEGVYKAFSGAGRTYCLLFSQRCIRSGVPL